MSTPSRIMRSEKDGIMAGVCSGLAHYLDIDPTLVRILFVFLTIAGGMGIFLYIVLAVITPSEAEVDAEIAGADPHSIDPVLDDQAHASRRRNNTALLAIILVFAGLSLLAGNLEIGPFVIPLLLIGIGYWIIQRER